MSQVYGSLRRLGSLRSYEKHLLIDGVKSTVASSSGKGGVGKSTTLPNLAIHSQVCANSGLVCSMLMYTARIFPP